jgi:hypothetical protein
MGESVMSLLDLDLVFWNQMLMRSTHISYHIITHTHTHIHMHHSQISYAAAQGSH